MAVCPEKCIGMEPDDEGFYYPKVDNSRCILCGQCDSVCPCLNKNDIISYKTSYYGRHKDADKLFGSSSGGAFIAIADTVMNRGGIVYGAAFDMQNLELIHTCSDKTPIIKIQKSKYTESNMKNVFTQIQQDIDSGRKVLFCGTPCQVSGLKKAINDKSHLLTTCDFICHGVPSSMLFKEHLQHILKNETPVDIDFRPKEYGWSSKHITIRTVKKTNTKLYLFDSFYYGFMCKNAFLRRCCYHCKNRQTHASDITLGDFWGYKKIDPALNDEKGLSLIVANNDFGRSVINDIRKSFQLSDLENKYSDYAFAERDYTQYEKTRSVFYAFYKKYGFEKAAAKTYMRGIRFRYLKYIVGKFMKSNKTDVGHYGHNNVL